MKNNIISEGGSGGHMLHPFSLPQVKTGKDLIEFFETAAAFVSKKSTKIKASESSSIKFDGVNASIKLIDGPGGKEFALDRGSLKPLDIEGVTAEKLPSRFVDKEKLEILRSVLGRYYQSGTEHHFKCPNCQHEKRTLSINLDKGAFKCWVCDYSGLKIANLIKRFGSFSDHSKWVEMDGKEGHGMIKIGKIMLDIFNQALPKIKPELESLGMWDDQTRFLNAEFVWEKTNIVKYPEDFIAIHGVNQYYEKTHYHTGEYRPGLTRPVGDDGKPVKDTSAEIEYDENALESLKEKVKPFSQKFGFNLYTVVPTKMREDIKSISFDKALDLEVPIKFDEKVVAKSLRDWLSNMINPRSRIVSLSDGRKVTALSRLVFQVLMGGGSLAELLMDPEDGQLAINGAIFYYATQVLGSVLLESLTSPLGDITGTETKHEGIVLRNKKLFGSRPVKITGDFITALADSPFAKKPEQVDPAEEEREEEPIQEHEDDLVDLQTDNPGIRRKIAVFPGKFKPPQKGHLETIRCMFDKGINHLYVLISPLPKMIGEKKIGVLESKSVWELYLKNFEFGDRVSVIASPFNSPVQASFDVMNGEVPAFIPQPGDLIIPVASDKPDRKSGKPDYEKFLKYHLYQPKLPGVIPGNILDYLICALSDEEGPIHASDFLNSLENGKEIHRFIPKGINPDDVRMRLGLDPVENQSLPGSLQRIGNEFNLLSMVENLLLEGDWQPIAKRRLDAAQKRLLDLGLQNPGKPFMDPRPIRKSNAFFAKEEVNNDNPDTSPITEEELEEISLAGAVEGAPGNILDPEDERKTT
jgi:transcription elongation factor Elf1